MRTYTRGGVERWREVLPSPPRCWHLIAQGTLGLPVPLRTICRGSTRFGITYAQLVANWRYFELSVDLS